MLNHLGALLHVNKSDSVWFGEQACHVATPFNVGVTKGWEQKKYKHNTQQQKPIQKFNLINCDPLKYIHKKSKQN